MDLREHRNSAIARWFDGDETQLVDLIRSNDLNKAEREFVARIVSGDAPKRSRGRKRRSEKSLQAGLIRFWLRDYEGWKGKDAINKAVEDALGVSRSAARKFFQQLDAPKTEGQAAIKHHLDWEISRRRVLIEHSDKETVQAWREADLKPN